MEKYGVHITNDHTKIASACPSCGSQVDNRYMTPRCPKCGTKPWETNGKKETKTKRRSGNC